MSGLTNNVGFNFLGLTNLSTAALDSVTIGSATILDLDGTNFTNCTTTTTPVTGNAIVNKSYVDNNFMSLTEDNAYTGLLNDFAGTVLTKTFSSTVGATFSGSCPSTAITPTLNGHLTRKLYVDDSITSAVADKASLSFPNTFDGSQTFSNLCIFNWLSTFNGLATFNVCPKSTINPVAGTNDLARVSYIENNFGIRQESNNWRQIQYFYEGIEVGNASGNNQNIQPNLGTENFNLLTEMEAAVVNIGAFGNQATWRWNTYLDLFKNQNITATTTLSFPIKQNYTIRTITTAISITLPAVTIYHLGITTNIFKTSSASQIVTLIPDATNKILAGNTITELSSDAISLGSGNLSTTLTVIRLDSGGYGWVSTSGTDYATLSSNNTFTGNVSVSGASSFTGNVSMIGNVNVSGNIVNTGNTTITVPLYNSSLNILSSFRECGVILYKAVAGSGNYINFPIWKSITNLTNFTSQGSISGALTTAQSGSVAGSYGSINTNDADALWLVSPNYGIIAYLNSGYTSTQLINYKNLTTYPVVVVGSTASLTSSVRVYYNDVEQT